MCADQNHAEISSLKADALGDGNNISQLVDIIECGEKASQVEKAIAALGELKATRAVEPLICSLLSKFVSVRHASISALGKIGNKKATKFLVMLLQNDQEPSYLREAILEALGNIGDSKAVQPLAKLVRNKEEDVAIRGATLKALCRIGTTEAIKTLLQTLEEELGGQSQLAEMALRAFKETGITTEAANHVLQVLDTDNLSAKKKAVNVLGELGDKVATKYLIPILEKYSVEDFDLLENVVRALGKIKDTEAVVPLLKVLKSNPLPTDEDYTIQNQVIFALGDIGDGRASVSLVNLLLAGQEFRIRWTASYALAKIGHSIKGEGIVPRLIDVLGNDRDDFEVRKQVAWALLQLDKGYMAIPLVKYLKNNHMTALKQMLFAESEIKI